MAPHSTTLAWKIPWMEEPGGLQSMGSLGVGHNRTTTLSLFTFMHWRREQQLTPVFLPGESQGRGSLVGCPLWGRTESDMTEATQQQQQQHIEMVVKVIEKTEVARRICKVRKEENKMQLSFEIPGTHSRTPYRCSNSLYKIMWYLHITYTFPPIYFNLSLDYLLI